MGYCYVSLKIKQGGFPSGLPVKNLPFGTGDSGSIPGQGTEFPHAMKQLSSRAATTEHRCPGAVPQIENPCANMDSAYCS